MNDDDYEAEKARLDRQRQWLLLVMKCCVAWIIGTWVAYFALPRA